MPPALFKSNREEEEEIYQLGEEILLGYALRSLDGCFVHGGGGVGGGSGGDGWLLRAGEIGRAHV